MRYALPILCFGCVCVAAVPMLWLTAHGYLPWWLTFLIIALLLTTVPWRGE